MDPDEPSTSKGTSSASGDAALLDSKIDDCAKKYNLSSKHVKNIIFHIVKDPRTLASLFTDDPNAIETLRLTRSRLKQLENVCKTKVDRNLKPVNPYAEPELCEEEDVEDEDYQPDDEEDDEDEDTAEEAMEVEPEDVSQLEQCTRDAFVLDVDPMIISQAVCERDPEYVNFLQGCFTDHTLAESDLLGSDTEDPDYEGDTPTNDFDDIFTGRHTKIPRGEVRSLYNDLLPDTEYDFDPLFDFNHIPTRSTLDLDVPQTPIKLFYEHEPTEHSPELRRPSPEQLNRIQVLSPKKPAKPKPPVKFVIEDDDTSWSLLERRKEVGKFTKEQVEVLREQMEKAVVITKENESQVRRRNAALRMLNELYAKMYSSPEWSIYNIKTLSDAVESCNEIETIQITDFRGPTWEDIQQKLYAVNISLPALCVLANSGALKYPALLPQQGPSPNATPAPAATAFLPSEQLLLALALYQLHHMPHATGGPNRPNLSKYQLIADHYLPNKTNLQIRNHVKNVRAGPMQSPLHQLIANAELGKWRCDFIISKDETRMEQRPLDWYLHNMPYWLTVVQETLRPAFLTSTEPTANTGPQAGPMQLTNEANDHSASLLDKDRQNLRFTRFELQVIRQQFEKHVQLLVQAIVSTTGNTSFIKCRNAAQRMMHDLNDNMNKPGNSSFFNLKQFEDAVLSCNEAEQASDDQLKTLIVNDKKALQNDIKMTNWKLGPALILAKSPAIIFSELLPVSPPEVFPNLFTAFLPSEQVLLALALYQLHHEPDAQSGEFNWKFKWIIDYFLPNKFIKSIRSQIQSAKSSVGKPSRSIQTELILRALNGEWHAHVDLLKPPLVNGSRPMDWHGVPVPHWISVIQKHCNPQQVDQPAPSQPEAAQVLLQLPDGTFQLADIPTIQLDQLIQTGQCVVQTANDADLSAVSQPAHGDVNVRESATDNNPAAHEEAQGGSLREPKQDSNRKTTEIPYRALVIDDDLDVDQVIEHEKIGRDQDVEVVEVDEVLSRNDNILEINYVHRDKQNKHVEFSAEKFGKDDGKVLVERRGKPYHRRETSESNKDKHDVENKMDEHTAKAHCSEDDDHPIEHADLNCQPDDPHPDFMSDQSSLPGCDQSHFSLDDRSSTNDEMARAVEQQLGVASSSTGSPSRLDEKGLQRESHAFLQPANPARPGLMRNRKLMKNAYQRRLDDGKKDVVYYGLPVRIVSRNSRKRERMERCMRGFRDQHVVHTWCRLALETVKQFARCRLFMHAGIQRAFVAIIRDPEISGSEKYYSLTRLLMDQSDLCHCVAALLPEQELTRKQRRTPNRLLFKHALTILLHINVYFTGQHNSSTKRRLIALIQQYCHDESVLRVEMRRLLTGHHDPLWCKLKQHFPNELITERPDMSKAEHIPLKLFNAVIAQVNPTSTAMSNASQSNRSNVIAPKVNPKLEHIDLTSLKPKPDFKPRIRLHNSYFQMAIVDGKGHGGEDGQVNEGDEQRSTDSGDSQNNVGSQGADCGVRNDDKKEAEDDQRGEDETPRKPTATRNPTESFTWVNLRVIREKSPRPPDSVSQILAKYAGYVTRFTVFTKADDRHLMETLNSCKGNRDKCVDKFVKDSAPKNLDVDLVERRLQYLLDLLQEYYRKQLQNQPDSPKKKI